ncbi:LuxR C-terminal-related transcriptional regulator [Streptomyces sp. NPDC057301]|uniref:helix-turn-helix transcriptional regulator n=1 Tax=Streptomyces sp. NPDC057301 TaxID=3346093 RepID=UPI003642B3DE
MFENGGETRMSPNETDQSDTWSMRSGTTWAEPEPASGSLSLATLEEEIRAIQGRVGEVRAGLAQLREVQHALGKSSGHGDELRRITGLREINALLTAAASECRESVATAQPRGPRQPDVLEQALPRDIAMLSRGVRMRTIYQHTARFSAPTQAYVEKVSALGGEVRTLAEFFERLIVFDRIVAFIPDPGDQQTAVVIRDPAVVEFLVGVFDRVWLAALPFSSAYESRTEDGIVSAIQRSIARLLLHEEKDAAIARRLGISERNCRGHISKLMKRLGARNRTHLGYLLASSDMLAADVERDAGTGTQR